MNKIDKKSLFAILFVAILAILSFLFKIEIMNLMRIVLEKGHLKAILLILVSIIVITHPVKIRPENDSSNLMIRSGVVPLDIFLTLSTYMAITTTACSLLEGAFIQNFFGVIYFNRFEELDIYVLLGVATLLLWYVSFHMYKMTVELLFITKIVSKSSIEMHNKPMQPTADAAAD